MLNLRNIARTSAPPSPDGIPVLALHSLGLDGEAWAAVAQATPDRDFYVYDQKGHGVASGDAPASLVDLVADANHALDLIDRPLVHLVGHSLGGAVAASLVRDGEERIASLSLIATPFAGLEVFRQRATAQADGTLRKVADSTLERWFGETASGPEVEMARAKLMAMTPAGFDASWHALAEFEGYDILPAPIPPALVCSFDEDQSTPPANGEAILRALLLKSPTVQHEVISGAGHMGVLTQAPAVSALLTQHWQSVEANQLEVAL
jgi:pimeloyl-ACP methyl ester carboxylesterase